MNNLFKNNIFSSLIIIILLLGNVYLTFQLISTGKELKRVQDETSVSTQATDVLKLFLDVVFNTRGKPSDDDRIKLENDIRQMKDEAITKAWDDLISSKDPKVSQAKAIEFIGLLEEKMENK